MPPRKRARRQVAAAELPPDQQVPVAPLETKAVAPAGVSVVAGVLTWALVTYIPAWKDGIPETIAALIPWAAAWLIATVTGYLAPHTARPDLALPPARDGK